MPKQEITPVRALGIIASRIQERIQVLESLRLPEAQGAVTELRIFQHQLEDAERYFLGKRAGSAAEPLH